jgi:hypothetical protein
MVLERVGRIEAHWSRQRLAAADAALEDALFRLALLQDALRRRLLSPGGGATVLNRHDPRLPRYAFDGLDAMAELLWSDTGEEVGAARP